jgi:hypothetical protein
LTTSNRLRPREDIVVSVCVTEMLKDDKTKQCFLDQLQDLKKKFRFFEVIIMSETEDAHNLQNIKDKIENLRIIYIQKLSNIYKTRVIAAQEAIGDTVLLLNPQEIHFFNIVDLLENSANNQSVALIKIKKKIVNRGLDTILWKLGKAAGFHIQLQFGQSLCLPRTFLNDLLKHPEPDLALRFIPNYKKIRLDIITCGDPEYVRIQTKISDRILLIQKLLIFLAPNILSIVASASALILFFGIIYFFYIILIWLIIADIATGWLTTSAVLSFLCCFFGVSTLGISLGIQKIISNNETNIDDLIINEETNTNMFAELVNELNVNLVKDNNSIESPEND